MHICASLDLHQAQLGFESVLREDPLEALKPHPAPWASDLQIWWKQCAGHLRHILHHLFRLNEHLSQHLLFLEFSSSLRGLLQGEVQTSTIVFAEACNKEICFSRLRNAPPGSSGVAPPPLGTSMQTKESIHPVSSCIYLCISRIYSNVSWT